MFKQLLTGLAMLGLLIAGANAQPGAADAFVRTISNDVLTTAKNDKAIQSGDINAIVALVDQKVMPAVAFETVTRSAVGPQWRSATPEQRQKLQAEFKTLLVRVYAGALTQLKDQTVEITKTQPVPGGTQVVVQSEVRGKGEPIKLDYRLDQVQGAWKIIDVNVGGIWLVQSYRSQFAQELGAGGIDGLIAKLVERNKAPVQPAKKG
ncbi:MlaC/ttg2D family ABC transporter substrate-binding protein [Rubrivivax benzoatilyticus]|uniref:ABC transporter substrate-binding protein n=1 Tax=Rubrivivax benzoatilyticus TaxID=316997 RepID=A0ABX0HPN6_9BURK|nr:ABC transporter substrate-binding protein [Rubrivivax benzoatilyticus]EGJ08871.1 toluene tolerance [Rubrivivax benzoatilyticus JA2 = ATCC BAA-35]NHK97034.1 ABC transporter substrate-binding protein [Rubrivivax benzoatilyticus]NHL24749.1 ABC transporter substrate-binding protein [Rubrivivax benzoatilyticus]